VASPQAQVFFVQGCSSSGSAAVWASLSFLGYLTPTFFAFYHRHKIFSERIDLSCALPLDNLDMTVPIGIPRASTISLYERLFR